MIAGIGVDIVNCSRMQSFLDDENKGLRFFAEDEYDYCRSRKFGSLESLAACFAAKEAFGKALGIGLKDINLKDIQVVHAENGKPELFLQNSAKDACNKRNVSRIHLSLSHEKESAVAFVVLETEEKEQ